MNKYILFLLVLCLVCVPADMEAKQNLLPLAKSLTQHIPPTATAGNKKLLHKLLSSHAKAIAVPLSRHTAVSSEMNSRLKDKNLTKQTVPNINISLVQLYEAHQHIQQQKMALFDAQAPQTTVQIENPKIKEILPFSATAFFIENNSNGNKELLGVTAAHIVDILGPDIELKIPITEAFSVNVPVKVIAKGNAGMGDIALLKPQTDVSDFIKPIALAKSTPKVNDKLRSYGFFEDAFHITRNRRVLSVSPSRLVTSFEYGNHDRAGACGGPVLNNQNEVVGIHCGSSEKSQESYVVPVSFLKDLLKANNNNGIHKRNLFFNGQLIGKINIDEYIYSIRTKRFGITLNTFSPWHQESKVDYNHLERLIPLAQANEVEIVLVQGGTPQTGHGHTATKRVLTVNLRTGKTTTQKFDSVF